jgi:prolyl 4-hydroxylase
MFNLLRLQNDAIFWYNLKSSGDGDYNTLHAGCPVLSGSKWVANQWIKETGQEFVRLCGLSEKD